MRNLVFKISVLGLFFAALSVQAIGLSVSPRELKFESQLRKATSGKINVTNSSGEVSVFEVYPDNFGNFIEVMPESFILESGESREVIVKAVPREEGIFRTDVSVEAFPVAKAAFNAGVGVKIPLTIEVGTPENLFLARISLLPSGSRKVLGVFLFIMIFLSALFITRHGLKEIKK